MAEHQIEGMPVRIVGTEEALAQWHAWQEDCIEPDASLELTIVVCGEKVFTGPIKEIEYHLSEVTG